MKLYPTTSELGILRPVFIATLALALTACGGSSTPEGDGTTTDGTTTDGGTSGVTNPDGIDVNGDGILDAEDDWDFSGTVDQDDVTAFAADAGTGGDGTDGGGNGDGNLDPDCAEVDCVSANADWSDNAVVAQNQSPTSTYAQGIQRIMYCLNYGGQGSTIAAYADGIYGPNSAADVTTYQGDEGLLEDGIVGEQTWEALQAELQGPISFDSEFNYWIVPSSREDCEAKILFYQRKADPMDWQQAEEPGSTVKIPFSVNAN